MGSNSSAKLKINDPIHGFVIFPEIIRRIVDSEEMQRLTRIRQLSGANTVFPGANHSRFEHSLGVAALTQRVLNLLKDIRGLELSQDDIEIGIISALLHDIGHGPFSHNFEGISKKFNKKDHEDYTYWIIKNSKIGDIINEIGYDKKLIAKIATGREISLESSKNKFAPLISSLITSAINVDSMDYLLRDNYHCGTAGRSVDVGRLILSMDINKDGVIVVDIRAMNALEEYFLTRLTSFKTIYFHKTCRAFQIMLLRAMYLAEEDVPFLKYDTPKDYLKWDDYILWNSLLDNEKSKPIMEDLRNRNLLKMCYETPFSLKKFNIDVEDLISKIRQESGVKEEEIFLDWPSSPSVPYAHESKSHTVLMYKRLENGSIEPIRAEKESEIIKLLQGNLNIIRVYTTAQNRTKVKKAAKNVFSSLNQN